MNTATKSALLCFLVAGCALDFSAGELELQEFDRTPAFVNVDGAPATVTCELTIVPQGVRTVQFAICSFVSPGGQKAGCLANSHVANVWSCDAAIPADTEDNTWTIEYVFSQDDEGSKFFLTGAELVGDTAGVLAGDATRVDLDVQSSLSDATAPSITGFTALPATVEPGGAVTCNITATDVDGSGVDRIGCTFLPDDSSRSVSCSIQGSSTCDIDISATADAGVTYTEVNHFARDVALNVTVGNLGRSFSVGTGGVGGAAGASGAGGVGGAELTSAGSYTASADQVDAAADLTFTALVRTTGSALIMALSNAALAGTDHASGAMLVRMYDFETSVRDGGIYTFDLDYSVVSNVWYRVKIVADIAASTYSVFVADQNGDFSVPVATNYTFRTGATATPMNYYNIFELSSTAELADASWQAGVCDITCNDLGVTCGSETDPCGGANLDCDTPNGGTCDTRVSGDVCALGACCTPNGAAWCSAQGYECSTFGDGCESTVSCGTCSGETPDCLPDFTCGVSGTGGTGGAGGAGGTGGYVRPTVDNTGPNNPGLITNPPSDSCPSTTGTGQTLQNFECTGGLQLLHDNTTVRNFIINTTDNVYGIHLNGKKNYLVEYGIVRKGSGYTDHSQLDDRSSGGTGTVQYVHFDQAGSDGMQITSSDASANVTLISNLFTRVGSNYKYNKHVDGWQTSTAYCGTVNFLGNRIVPFYCSGETSGTGEDNDAGGGDLWGSVNSTFQGADQTSCAATYNFEHNWIDGSNSGNIMMSGNSGSGGGTATMNFKDNRFGNKYQTFYGSNSGTLNDQGGNVWECNGASLTVSANPTPPGCTLNGNLGSVSACSGLSDNMPVDPTRYLGFEADTP